MPANLPNMEEIRAATAGKSQAEIAASARKTLEGMDPQKVAAFGQGIPLGHGSRVLCAVAGHRVGQGLLFISELHGVLLSRLA